MPEGSASCTVVSTARPYLFGFRKAGAITGKSRESFMRSIRPTGNVLAGYVPSYAMGRVLEDATS